MARQFDTLDSDALRYHSEGRPGKIGIEPTKPAQTQQDLALAYSPGVAAPARAIAADPADAYRYTGKGNLVAVVSNGSAVLGLDTSGTPVRATLSIFTKPTPIFAFAVAEGAVCPVLATR